MKNTKKSKIVFSLLQPLKVPSNRQQNNEDNDSNCGQENIETNVLRSKTDYSVKIVLKFFLAVVNPVRFLDEINKSIEAEDDLNFVWDKEILQFYEKLLSYGFDFSDCFDSDAIYALTICHLNSY